MKLLAPNGKPSKLNLEQYRLVRTPAFKKWFGDWLKAYETGNYDNVSKAIDKETKEPLVVYHGTENKFNKFDLIESRFGYFYFAINKNYAEKFGKVKSYFINARKIKDVTSVGLKKITIDQAYKLLGFKVQPSYKYSKEEFWQHLRFSDTINKILKLNKYDGVKYIEDFTEDSSEITTEAFAILNSNQIKLADGTNTTFDANNPDIRFDYGGNVLIDKMPTFIAPNGNRSNLIGIKAEDENGKWVYLYDIVRTAKFKEWFGDWEEAYITKDYDYVSKIIDENGEPSICYHTTSNEFFEFSENFIGSRTDAGYYGKGFYFTEGTPDSHYGEREIPCFLNIRNPFLKQSSYRNYELNTEDLKNKGFDGVIVFSDIESVDLTKGLGYRGNRVEEIVAYYSEQIKLADATNTTFDRYDSDIRYERGGSLSKTPAPKKERIYGSKVNKPKSSESKSKASSIILSPSVIKSINSILEKHNEKSNKKIPLATAKAVVRRGMGAYSSTHRPTIKGGKPNSRVAWGLARLNAFIYKIEKGYSKSGKYNQDDDLINELAYKVKNYENGGGIETEEFYLTTYRVSAETEKDSNELYIGFDIDRAELEFNSANISDFPDYGGIVMFMKKTDKYKFIGDLEDGYYQISDFPIEDYFNDRNYYKLIEQGEYEEIKNKVVDPINESSDKLLNDVESHYKNIYGKWKYNKIIVDNGKDYFDNDYIEYGCIQLRVANHSENVKNIDKLGDCDYYISVVIADKDNTKGKFLASMFERRSNEIEFTFNSDNNFDEIILEVDEEIERAKKYIIDKNTSKEFNNGGTIEKLSFRIPKPKYKLGQILDLKGYGKVKVLDYSWLKPPMTFRTQYIYDFLLNPNAKITKFKKNDFSLYEYEVDMILSDYDTGIDYEKSYEKYISSGLKSTGNPPLNYIKFIEVINRSLYYKNNPEIELNPPVSTFYDSYAVIKSNNNILLNGGQTKQHTFRVPLNDVKKNVDNIQNNINDIRKKLKWHEGKRVKYPVTKKERDVINDSLIPLRKEMQRIYDVYTAMKKKKQKTVSDSELKIKGFDIKTFNHAVSIVNDKYLLNYHDLNKNQTIDVEFHQHIDFVVAEKNLNNKIFNFSKMIGDVEQAIEYAKIIIDKNAQSFEKPYLLLQNNEDELDLEIIKYDDYKENIDNYSDYKIIYRNNAGIDIELQERTEKFKRESEINEEILIKLGIDSNVKQAITDLITLDKYSRLTQNEGEYLYFLFKNYENLVDEYDEYVSKIVMPKDKDEESVIKEIIEGLEAKQYIYFSTYDETAEAYKIAIDFINSVRGRVQTIKAKQSGMDLFPETEFNILRKSDVEDGIKSLETLLEIEPDNQEYKDALESLKVLLETLYFKEGGEINDKEETYKKWKKLVNMTPSELKKFLDSEEGKIAGLTEKEADELGIDYGRKSAKWILKMKPIPYKEWTPNMWRWAKKQIRFISRMTGNKGKLYDEKGNRTRKYLSLLVWGNNPLKNKK